MCTTAWNVFEYAQLRGCLINVECVLNVHNYVKLLNVHNCVECLLKVHNRMEYLLKVVNHVECLLKCTTAWNVC